MMCLKQKNLKIRERIRKRVQTHIKLLENAFSSTFSASFVKRTWNSNSPHRHWLVSVKKVFSIFSKIFIMVQISSGYTLLKKSNFWKFAGTSRLWYGRIALCKLSILHFTETFSLPCLVSELQTFFEKNLIWHDFRKSMSRARVSAWHSQMAHFFPPTLGLSGTIF